MLVKPTCPDLARVMPVILPLELLDMAWPGPIVRIGTLPFAMAWADCVEGNKFFYVTADEAQAWDEADIDWRAIAFDNLSRLARRQPASGRKDDEHGRPFVMVMLHPDALGPSRLLVPHLFDEILGPDYQVAIPERTCAIAFRRELTPAQAADITAMIGGCYRHGTEPMSPERFDARAFWSPDAR
ncbi:hypothetical protein [Sphingomonas sp. GM_Shp_1]|uniref:hypothetical protein n=1 Tax=Sphingomonas sp. GM_Shp_1 TaxID=2937381 RepID=UPI00226B311C|nr:hypothetical protein [Sphingomonas sp. GM_Shp_1]